MLQAIDTSGYRLFARLRFEDFIISNSHAIVMSLYIKPRYSEYIERERQTDIEGKRIPHIG